MPQKVAVPPRSPFKSEEAIARIKYYESLPIKEEPKNSGKKMEDLFARAKDFAENCEMPVFVTVL